MVIEYLSSDNFSISGCSFINTTTCGVLNVFTLLSYLGLNKYPFFNSSKKSYCMNSPCLLLGQSRKNVLHSSCTTYAISAFFPGTIIIALSCILQKYLANQLFPWSPVLSTINIISRLSGTRTSL